MDRIGDHRSAVFSQVNCDRLMTGTARYALSRAGDGQRVSAGLGAGATSEYVFMQGLTGARLNMEECGSCFS